MKVKYEDRLKQKAIATTTDTLVAGVDIAKNYQWARFVDFRGIEHDHALKFKNSKGDFENILARIREICKKENFAKAVVGMETTGHYWKAFAKLVKDGRYFELYLPQDIYAELWGCPPQEPG